MKPEELLYKEVKVVVPKEPKPPKAAAEPKAPKVKAAAAPDLGGATITTRTAKPKAKTDEVKVEPTAPEAPKA